MESCTRQESAIGWNKTMKARVIAANRFGANADPHSTAAARSDKGKAGRC
jgi:hypothetical protein